jgi:fatty acyl-CoA reductase
MVQIYKKLHRSVDTMNYFTKRSWEWTHENPDILRGAMTPEDIQSFYFDPRPIHWQTYLENFCMGTRKYVLKEDVCNLPTARAHIRK